MSAAWAVGTPKTTLLGGWCLACQLSSSGHTHMPAWEWPVCIQEQTEQRCNQICIKGGTCRHQNSTPVQLHDTACANNTCVVKIKSLFDIRCPNYPARVAKNWISASLIKRKQTHTHISTCFKTAVNHTVDMSCLSENAWKVNIWWRACAKTVCPRSPWSG